MIACLHCRPAGDHLYVPTIRITEESYMEHVISSYSVLCLPGLGYDTFRLWESIAAGYCFCRVLA